MAKKNKQLSNPYSTGNGGGHFEANVQASFVALMLTGGYTPCLPRHPIQKIQLQGRFIGYNTDDLIVFIEKADASQKYKILGQIKRSIKISEKDKVFAEVIKAAWIDFNNKELFSKGNDAITLITGPLSIADSHTRDILEWARHSTTSKEFIDKVELSRFSSSTKRSKLRAFKVNLRKANNSGHISDEDLFVFLKHFHLLNYDLDIKSGVALSLLHSLIGHYSEDKVQHLWSRLVDEVQSVNKNGGTITLENLPEDLQEAFKQKTDLKVIPPNFSNTTEPNWNEHRYANDLAIMNLIGSWDESNETDLEAIRQIVGGEYYEIWLRNIRNILQDPDGPIAIKNGRWYIKDRKALWNSLGSRIFDSTLKKFKEYAFNILSERDPKFYLQTEDFYSLNFLKNTLTYSFSLRKGIAEGLALLGSQPEALINCSADKKAISLLIHDIFKTTDWALWSSLNDLLPILAEAAPNEFLTAIETALQQSPCPFEKLFAQNGVFGESYITGLLRALETLAWNEKFLVWVSSILGDLANRDSGGNYDNQPLDALRTVFLPWFPQTTASVEKRKIAIKTLQDELPSVAWKLLLRLLPNQQQTSSGSSKPYWRNTLPQNIQEPVVEAKEYWEQVSFYADLVVSAAIRDITKLIELITHLNKLPQPALDKVIEHLSSITIINMLEEERIPIWNALMDLSYKKSHLSSEVVSKLKAISATLAPQNPLNLYRRLFDGRDLEWKVQDENFESYQKKSMERRCKAVQEILEFNGVKAVIQLARSVECPLYVGNALGVIAKKEADQEVFPALLKTTDQQLSQFMRGYIWSRHYTHGWAWIDNLDKTDWSKRQIGQFLSYLPFTDGTWKRAINWLGKQEGEYWKRTEVNLYQENQTHFNLEVAIDKLIGIGRSKAAVNCLYYIVTHKKWPLNKPQSVKALLAATSSTEPPNQLDEHYILEIIKTLQHDLAVNSDELCQIEWAYLPLLIYENGNNTSLKALENRLSSDPNFFSEMIRLVYRSKKEAFPEKELNDKERSLAINAFRLLDKWHTPPSWQLNGLFSVEQFKLWFQKTKDICTESGHLERALDHIGQVLIYCPPDPEGLWINKTIAEYLNEKDNQEMRDGFSRALFNSRGVHWVDPTGKEEQKLAEKYLVQAEAAENVGYYRLATTLKQLAEHYNRDATRIIEGNQMEN